MQNKISTHKDCFHTDQQLSNHFALPSFPSRLHHPCIFPTFPSFPNPVPLPAPINPPPCCYNPSLTHFSCSYLHIMPIILLSIVRFQSQVNQFWSNACINVCQHLTSFIALVSHLVLSSTSKSTRFGQ